MKHTQYGLIWSDEDCAKLIELVDQGRGLQEIAIALGRKYGAIRTKLKRLRPGVIQKRLTWTEEDKRKLVELRDNFDMSWTEIGKRLGRPSGTVYDKYTYLKEMAARCGRVESSNGKFTVPDSVIADRERRRATPRTLTGDFCGDPPPGFSALDRKRQGLAEPVYIDNRLAQLQRKPSLVDTSA